MSVIYIVLPIALVVVFVAVAAFVWSARRGQFDDLTTPAIRAIQDDGRTSGNAEAEDPTQPGEPPEGARNT